MDAAISICYMGRRRSNSHTFISYSTVIGA